ncbi:MAG: zinc ribbon domain-containing protein, partial [Elusimicrobiota bacterium]
PFAGLMKCGHCDEHRAVTFEVKKKRFVYAHCTGVRKPGICPESKYVRLEELDKQFREALKAVQLTPEMANFIMDELGMESGDEATAKVTQLTLMKQEIGRLKTRIDQAYTDKLDGKIPEDLWTKKNSEWQLEKVGMEEKAKNLEESGPASYLPSARKVLELSERLETLYLSASPLEKRELVDCVCSNLFLHGKRVEFTYKMPFDLWAEGHRSARWLPD